MIVSHEILSLCDRKIHKQTYVLNSLKTPAISGQGDKISGYHTVSLSSTLAKDRCV